MFRIVFTCIAIASLGVSNVASAQDNRDLHITATHFDEIAAANAALVAARTPEAERDALQARAEAAARLERTLEGMGMSLRVDAWDDPAASEDDGVIVCNDVDCTCTSQLTCLVTKGLCAFGGHEYSGGTHVGTCTLNKEEE